MLLKELLSGLTHTGDALKLIDIIGTNWGELIVENNYSGFCINPLLYFLIMTSFSIFYFFWVWGLSGRVLDSRPRGRGFKPHRRHCVVVLEQDTFILA